jgi:hypothetical protein
MDSPASDTAGSRATPTGQTGPYDSPRVDDAADVAEQTSPIEDSGPEQQPQKAAVGPTQKRRRVTRACDECRRKKIKCDGKQPCTHCTVYSYGMAPLLPNSIDDNNAPSRILT